MADTSPGSYKGVAITAGDQASIQSQMAAIDAKGGGKTDTTVPGTTTTPAGSSTTTPAPSSSDAFIAELQKSLLGESGMISSSNSNIEDSIDKAIASVKSSTASSDAAITSAADRNRQYQLDANGNSETGFFESRAGYATPTVAFANLREYNAKAIRDLDDRKNEAILQGDATAAGKIADLQLQKLTFEQTAAQQTFTRLLSTGQFALQAQQADQATKAQTFQEQQAKTAIALQYGIKLDPNDTLDSLVTKAMPMASQEQKLKLAQMSASINASNATAAKALADAKSDAPLDAASIAALAAAYRTPGGSTIIAAQVKNPANLSKIFAASTQLQNNDVTTWAQQQIAAGVSMPDALKALQSPTGSLAITDPTAAASALAAAYAAAPAKASGSNTNLPGLVGSGASSYSGSVNSFLEFLTGIPEAGKYK